MGVMDFMKSAGEKIGLGSPVKEAKEAAAKAKAAADLKEAQKKRAEAARKAASAQKAKKQAAERERKAKERVAARKAKEQEADAAKAEKLASHITGLGLKVRGLKVTFADGAARVSGTVANRATKERVILAIGNVEGVSQVRDAIKVTPARKAASNTAAARARRKQAAAAQTMHTVKSGDSLSAIAKKYLGDANRYPEIFKANQPMLTDPNKIYPGQVLRIPRK